MNKQFVKEHGDKATSELTNDQVMVAVVYITKLKDYDATAKRNLIQSFLLGWTNIAYIYNNYKNRRG